jgi:hypothetical protein
LSRVCQKPSAFGANVLDGPTVRPGRPPIAALYVIFLALAAAVFLGGCAGYVFAPGPSMAGAEFGRITKIQVRYVDYTLRMSPKDTAVYGTSCPGDLNVAPQEGLELFQKTFKDAIAGGLARKGYLVSGGPPVRVDLEHGTGHFGNYRYEFDPMDCVPTNIYDAGKRLWGETDAGDADAIMYVVFGKVQHGFQFAQEKRPAQFAKIAGIVQHIPGDYRYGVEKHPANEICTLDIGYFIYDKKSSRILLKVTVRRKRTTKDGRVTLNDWGNLEDMQKFYDSIVQELMRVVPNAK